MIEIRGARANNLKNINVDLPDGKLIVVTGLSGSGKSSLVFDTLFAEGQRRYVESLSSYARQFLGRMNKPDVDYIHGLSPAVAIEQKVNSTNPRSTVGTQTEVYEYLKLLFARVGRTFSPVSGVEVKRHTVSDVVDYILSYELRVKSYESGVKVMILAPLEDSKERPLRSQLEILEQEGYQRVMVKGTVVRIEDCLDGGILEVGSGELSTVYLVIDRIELRPGDDGQAARIAESVQSAFFEGRGSCCVYVEGETTGDSHLSPSTFHHFSNRFEADGITFEKPNPNFFSFNNPYGACPTCQGYGSVIGIDPNLVVPNKSRSIYDDAVVCWKGDKMQDVKREFIRHAAVIDFPIHTPYYDLTQEQLDVLWHGDGVWEGIDGFFRWVESQAYKIQYRVMLARYRGRTVCPECRGHRLRKDANYVKVGGRSINEVVDMPVADAEVWVRSLGEKLTDTELQATARLRTEIEQRLQYLLDVGLGYLTLSRESRSLSGGESQRINLATSLGSSLVGSMYILDEPSIGLHSRDTQRLIGVLKKLRDLGNTVIVVEHDEEIMRAADWLVDIGPGAGTHGGEVVFSGQWPVAGGQLPVASGLSSAAIRSLTLDYLSGKLTIPVPKSRRPWRDRIRIEGAYLNNLKHIDVEIPLGVLTVVTGVSGSGKSSLVKGVLCDVLQHRMDGSTDYVGSCKAVSGDLARISQLQVVDQNPIGRSTRSNPATYIKAFDDIRALYAKQPLAKSRGYKASFFSFNVEGGRCEECQGEGYVTVPMQFMSDLHLVCEECHGSRYKEEALEVTWHGKNISQVLEMSVDEAISFFDTDETRSIKNRLQALQDVGLGYLTLGQSSSSLSGGEAQRIKLAAYLVQGLSDTQATRQSNNQSILFVFDEPSTGLHLYDIGKLLAAFDRLIERGHSVVVVEHHHDIIKTADWVIDLGPEGGAEGGNVVFAGTPEELVKCKESYTAKFIKLKVES